MNIAVFTSNQPRHIALIEALLDAGHEVVAVIEPKTMLLPEQPTLREYWRRVRDAERDLFGTSLPAVPTLCLKPGELSSLDNVPWPGRDRHVVFSSSFITGHVADYLIERGALNLHVGIAPEMRGSAPNAHAMYLGRPDLIGAQVQRLSRGLDAGDILAEVRPPAGGDYFMRSMRAVRLGIDALVALLDTPEPWLPVRPNDRAKQIRYARRAEFDETVAAKIMDTASC